MKLYMKLTKISKQILILLILILCPGFLSAVLSQQQLTPGLPIQRDTHDNLEESVDKEKSDNEKNDSSQELQQTENRSTNDNTQFFTVEPAIAPPPLTPEQPTKKANKPPLTEPTLDKETVTEDHPPSKNILTDQALTPDVPARAEEVLIDSNKAVVETEPSNPNSATADTDLDPIADEFPVTITDDNPSQEIPDKQNAALASPATNQRQSTEEEQKADPTTARFQSLKKQVLEQYKPLGKTDSSKLQPKVIEPKPNVVDKPRSKLDSQLTVRENVSKIKDDAGQSPENESNKKSIEEANQAILEQKPEDKPETLRQQIRPEQEALASLNLPQDLYDLNASQTTLLERAGERFETENKLSVDTGKIGVIKSLIKDKRYEQAVQISQGVNASSPSYPDALFHRCHAYDRMQQLDNAIESCLSLSRDFPDHHLADNALVQSAAIYHRQRQYHAAIALYTEILRFYPQGEQLDDALYLLGQIYETSLEHQDKALAKKLYTRLLNNFSNRANGNKPYSPYHQASQTALDRLASR